MHQQVHHTIENTRYAQKIPREVSFVTHPLLVSRETCLMFA